MNTKLIIPEKYKPTRIPAKNIYDEWFLVPKALITEKNRTKKFDCYRFMNDGRVNRNRVYPLNREYFDL